MKNVLLMIFQPLSLLFAFKFFRPMQLHSLSLVLSIVLLSSTLAFTQNQEAAIELSKTNGNHKLLGTLTGTWTFIGKANPPEPNQKPFEFNGTITRKAIMDGRFFVLETTGGQLPMSWSDGKMVTFREMQIEGYDNVKKKFVTSSINNVAETGILITEGSYDAVTQTFTHEGEFKTNTGIMLHLRYVVKIMDNDHYVTEAYETIDGRERKTTEIKYARTKGK